MLGFDLDPFQVDGCAAVQAGRSVLVAAPTGAGKTVVGEFAVDLALREGRKAIYTTPIKALSNQKYHDLLARYGKGTVGLLTGDASIDGEAPVVVMTTEVLRNMLYAQSTTLTGLGYVVMDEVHYLADRFRGPVWEEVIIHLPPDVRLIALSATVSNAEEFGDWLRTVRGDTQVVVSEHRPVPLFQHVMVGSRLLDLFAEEGAGQEHVTVNPQLRSLVQQSDRATATSAWRQERRGRGNRRSRAGGAGPGSATRAAGDRGYRGHGVRGSGQLRPARREVVLDRLDRAGLLPAITFIFSRAGCDAAVAQCLAAGVRLTDARERTMIGQIVDAGVAEISHSDLQVLGYDRWRAGLENGLAAHHAGLLPAFKTVVEELFSGGLVKAVFATETLALGINMPARSVVLEKLVKFNGQSHADITPGEYTQLTGRAGRRGIDVEGHAVVLWQPGMDPSALAGLASTRTYPLRSSFRPTYNMSVNLVGQVGYTSARAILETSFAQFQADRSVVDLAGQLREQDEALAGYREAMSCHLGDFAEYHGLTRRISAAEKAAGRRSARRARRQVATSVQRLRRGDVIAVPSGRRAGYALVLDPDRGGSGGARPWLLNLDAQVRRMNPAELSAPVRRVGQVRIGRDVDTRKPKARRDLAASMRAELAGHRGRAEPDTTNPDTKNPDTKNPDTTNTGGADSAGDQEITRLREQLRAHPCHGCAHREDHARWARRADELAKQRAGVAQRINSRTNSVAAAFDKVCALLVDLEYLVRDGDRLQVTEAGRMLGSVYSEKDLVIAQCLRAGTWRQLDPAGMAAVAAALVYESRGEEVTMSSAAAPASVRRVVEETVAQWSAVTGLEAGHKMTVTPDIDLGLVPAMHAWARERGLAEVLETADLPPGDFVRWSRQTLDLLNQLSLVAEDPVAAAARSAVRLVDRGVVALAALTR
ncbi:MAG: RNA helicase [Micrococcales bacterium]|nr:MAG: RNA helicase [Micrococcales bacterium]PIE27413.1 MAG: RNA helicase [Micrococcales bacterium]